LTTIENKKNRKKVFVAGGGTGGHLFPGMAIARALQKLDPEIEIAFVGTADGIEARVIPKSEFELVLLPGGKLNMSGQWSQKIKTLVRLPLAFFRSCRILLSESPVIVLGVGGYASGPFMLAASALGFPTAIWEPNAYPGLANRWLAKWVDQCFVVFEETRAYFPADKVVRMGMPIRQEIEAEILKFRLGSAVNEAKASAARPLRIFCFGGSQGSRMINNCLFEVLKKWDQESESQFELIHQIGATDWLSFKDKYQGFRNSVTALEFVDDMPVKYQWADVVISRAGASTVAELSGFAKASVLIPLAAADGHQAKNAQALVDVGAAQILLQKDLTPESLRGILNGMLDAQKRQKMEQKVKVFFEPRAAESIARQMISSLL
jgi:UDP-N-acetylglucosamine--N-acetylmuramyl-(pentapeptide) pyrophosphoryl-undecaprenol N-acetylglucosamine transferase